MPLLREVADELDAAWVSEHLSFNQASWDGRDFTTGFLLPPRQTWAGVEAAVGSIRSVAGKLTVPFAIETGVNYLRPRDGELRDGQFVAEVALSADCGILLDLHNIWANERNGRQTVDAFLADLPLDRVWEIHVAGGEEQDGFWLDAHSGPVPPAVLDILMQLVPALPTLGAIVYEIFPSYLFTVGLDEVRRQVEILRVAWQARAPLPTAVPGRICGQQTRSVSSAQSPREWEDTLGALVVGHKVNSPLACELASDPGVDLMRKLIHEFRGSMLVNTLTLTCRLLMLCLGTEAFDRLLDAFFRKHPPPLFASIEAATFADYLREEVQQPVQHLTEILAFESAVLRAILDGERPVVAFDRDPVLLLRALSEGRLPGPIPPGSYEIEITPDVRQRSLATAWSPHH
jgi:hypothetical protein